jgi:hypothetical protein
MGSHKKCYTQNTAKNKTDKIEKEVRKNSYKVIEFISWLKSKKEQKTVSGLLYHA